MSSYVEIDAMLGKVFDRVTHDWSSVTFRGDTSFRMMHIQDCCEDVQLEEVIGDLDDLCGEPILEAECVTNYEEDQGESCTWTFYKLGTRKGHVTLRWLGTSNGYYSESVDMIQNPENLYDD